MLTLSVLDQSPIRLGGTPGQAIQETLELAALADRLGYRRYWVAEHHSSAGLAGTAPEILVARIAGLTRHLRVGSGGVMLSHYSALKVAETFRVLEALYPGRIDMGIGRAPGSDQRTAMALQHGPGALPIEHFPQQVGDLLDYLRDQVRPDHPFFGVRAMPSGPSAPEPWLLGSSDQSAIFAAHFGTFFSFAHFITDRGGVEVMDAYRRYFRPSPWLDRPVGSIGVFALAAETDEAAERLAKSRDLWRLRLEQGILGPIPPVEEAEAYPYTDADRARIAHHRRRQVVGSATTVRVGIEALAAGYGVEEVVVVSICFDHQARLRSYQLIAEAFGLTPPS